MKFYAYMYLHENGIPYYVGKGHKWRVYDHCNHRAKPPKNREQIILEHYLTEEDAFFAEKFLIALYGRKDLGTGCLWNLTDGGEGVTGLKRSPENIEKMRRASLGRKHSPESREKMRQAMRGKPKSQDHIEKVRQAMKLRKCPWVIERNKLGPSPEIRGKMSEAAKKRWLTKPPKRDKGLRKWSETTRAKVAATRARKKEKICLVNM